MWIEVSLGSLPKVQTYMLCGQGMSSIPTAAHTQMCIVAEKAVIASSHLGQIITVSCGWQPPHLQQYLRPGLNRKALSVTDVKECNNFQEIPPITTEIERIFNSLDSSCLESSQG